MRVSVIGSHGGVAHGFRGTSHLIDGKLLIDAGSVASGISISEQVKIEHILISHSHLDHISDLAFLADNCFGIKDRPFEIYTSKVALGNITTHILNDDIWPDFTKIPSVDNPMLRFHVFKEGPFRLGSYTITAIKVNHPAGGHGVIVEKEGTALLFTLDTGPTEEIWEIAKRTKGLAAIFTEVSFPNHQKALAKESFHHTPRSMQEEIKKMPPHTPIFLGHLKPNYEAQIKKEIAALNNERISILGSEGIVYSF